MPFAVACPCAGGGRFVAARSQRCRRWSGGPPCAALRRRVIVMRWAQKNRNGFSSHVAQKKSNSLQVYLVLMFSGFICCWCSSRRWCMTGSISSPPVSHSKRAKPLQIPQFHSSVGRDVTRAGCKKKALFRSLHVNPVNTKNISHRMFWHMHGVLNEVYLQIFFAWSAVNCETNLISLLNP